MNSDNQDESTSVNIFYAIVVMIVTAIAVWCFASCGPAYNAL